MEFWWKNLSCIPYPTPLAFRKIRVCEQKQQACRVEHFGNVPNEAFEHTEKPRLDATTMPKKSIQGTPWYQILSNMQYADDFYYIGAFVDEREALIKDGDMEEGNDCEQSDIVMILLNLACIPDDIA